MIEDKGGGIRHRIVIEFPSNTFKSKEHLMAACQTALTRMIQDNWNDGKLVDWNDEEVQNASFRMEQYIESK